jgi:hypothetical protein
MVVPMQCVIPPATQIDQLLQTIVVTMVPVRESTQELLVMDETKTGVMNEMLAHPVVEASKPVINDELLVRETILHLVVTIVDGDVVHDDMRHPVVSTMVTAVMPIDQLPIVTAAKVAIVKEDIPEIHVIPETKTGAMNDEAVHPVIIIQLYDVVRDELSLTMG